MEQDELAASPGYSREDDLAYYGNLRPPIGYRPDGKVIQLRPVTRDESAEHRDKFQPPKEKREARRIHEKSCDEVAALFGIAGADGRSTLLDLRREGKSLGQIAELTGVPLKRVKDLVRAG